MRSSLQALILAVSLSTLAVGSLGAQPPLDPPPNVELREAFTVGSDVAVTFAWASDGAPPPASAKIKLLDAQGLDAGTVSFTPLYGPQTIWIPGGATPRASDASTSTLVRHFELVTDPTKEIVLEEELAVSVNGPVQILAPNWPLLGVGKQCYLHVVSVACKDPEDANGDEPYLVIQGLGTWTGPKHVPGNGVSLPINWVYLVCDTCQNIQKDTKLDLWDADDPGFPLFDPDDHLGSENVTACKTTSLKTVKMSGLNYTYELKYRVACFEDPC